MSRGAFLRWVFDPSVDPVGVTPGLNPESRTKDSMTANEMFWLSEVRACWFVETYGTAWAASTKLCVSFATMSTLVGARTLPPVEWSLSRTR